MIEPRALQRAFASAPKAVRNLEGNSVAEPLPHLRFHDLRHTCASLLLARNVHPKVVAARLGHSSVRVTLDTYSHLIDGMQTEAAAILGDMISGKSPTKSLPKRKLRVVA
jgi:integrase